MNNAHVIACAEVFRGDGEILASAIGAVPRAGAELARATFEPDLVLTDGVAHAIDAEGRVEGWIPYRRVFDLLWRGKRHVLMGAAQIDRFGNSNISCVGPHERPKVQLLGARGAPGNTVCHATSYWVPRHSRRVFVEKVDFVSGVGTDRGALQLRHVVTDLCVLDFESPDGALRLRSLHPGVTVEQVQDRTGFDLHIPEQVPRSRSPSAEEASWLAARG